MKKLILLLLIANASQSQNLYFSAGIDVRNAIAGSKPTNNKSELDLNFKFGLVSNKGVEITINYEKFNAIDFNRFAFGVGQQIEVTEKIKVVPTLEYGLINRSGNWGGGFSQDDVKSSHLGFGFSLPIRYEINDYFAIELQSQLLQRTDINTKYGGNNFVLSNFVNLVYKIGL